MARAVIMIISASLVKMMRMLFIRIALGRDDLKMMALMLHDCKARLGLTNSGGTAEVALLLEKTVRLWRKDFFVNKGEFSEYQQGSYGR